LPDVFVFVFVFVVFFHGEFNDTSKIHVHIVVVGDYLYSYHLSLYGPTKKSFENHYKHTIIGSYSYLLLTHFLLAFSLLVTI